MASENPPKSPWWIVFGSTSALIVGTAPVILFTAGIFMKPLHAEFGWNRTQLSAGITAMQLLSVVIGPVMGTIMDKWGIRRVLIALSVLFFVNVALLSTVQSLFMLLGLYALFGLTGGAGAPMPYVKSISAFFDQHRGLALGIAMAGVGIGSALVPQYAQYLVGHHGWRTAYLGLAALFAVIAFPSIFFFVREPGDSSVRSERIVDVSQDPTALPGMTARQALASPTFWLLAGVVFLVSAVVNGITVHAVPLLTDRGYSAATAASFMIATGFSAMAGRLFAGFLFDRFFAPYIGAFFFLLAIAGLYFLLKSPTPIVGVICLGLTQGTEIDLIGYLVSRYFGLRNLGLLYGLIFAAFNAGGSLGPISMGAAYTARGSYELAFYLFGGMLIAAIALILWLGRYPYGGEKKISALEPQLA
jgi:predicted MFS family arabinose efflux permease